MSELLILDFDGVDEADYLKVNRELGLDPGTGAGDWPAGLITHVAGVSDAGHGYVIEVWESQQAQADFMNSRLGAAMAGGGISAVPQVTWARVMGHHNPGLWHDASHADERARSSSQNPDASASRTAIAT